MSDGRCFTIHTASTLLNDKVMESNNIMPQDNYSFRKLLQKQGPALVQKINNVTNCGECNEPLLNVRNTY
jgi:hypothetical protein